MDDKQERELAMRFACEASDAGAERLAANLSEFAERPPFKVPMFVIQILVGVGLYFLARFAVDVLSSL